jgi:hypothetical protein
MDLIALGNKENKSHRGFPPRTQSFIKPNSNPLTPEIPLSPLSHKGTGGLISRGQKWTGQTARKYLSFMCHVVDHALNKNAFLSGCGPIREISVASFWYFLREKVLRDFMGHNKSNHGKCRNHLKETQGAKAPPTSNAYSLRGQRK